VLLHCWQLLKKLWLKLRLKLTLLLVWRLLRLL
jgi:hypothetical protein